MSVAGTELARGIADVLPAGPRPPTPKHERRGRLDWIPGAIGIALLIAVWEILALTVFHKVGSGVPTPTSVVSKFWSDWRSGLYWHNLKATLREATTGFVVGDVLAIALALVFVQVPLIEKALLRVAIASYCLPIIAIGPILKIVLHGDAPQSALAALLVFFPTLVGVVVGLRSADRAALEVIRASGGGSWTQLFKVRLRAALPSTFAGLQIAAPSALLGAVIGEYLGSVSTGLGIMMIDAQGALEIARTWGIALLLAAVAGVAYAAIGLVGKLVAPWAATER